MTVPNKVFIKDDNLVARNIGGETLIVPIRNRVGDLSAIFTLNEVAARVWQLLDTETPLERIVETIQSEYDVAPDVAAADIAELVQSWEEAGLVRPNS